MLGWDHYGFDKKRDGTCCTELVLLHLVGSTVPILRFGTSEVSNVDALFFMLRWSRTNLTKKHIRTNYGTLVFLCPVGVAVNIVLFGMSGA
jgi:hypothetical protein